MVYRSPLDDVTAGTVSASFFCLIILSTTSFSGIMTLLEFPGPGERNVTIS